MRRIASLLLLTASLAGCAAAPGLPLYAQRSEEGLNFASQAAEPARAVQLLSAESDGQRATIEYAVLRGATPHKRRLSIDFRGEPQNPDAWQLTQSSLNGVRLAKGALAGAEAAMIKQELSALKAGLSLLPPAPEAGSAAPSRSIQALPGTLRLPSMRNRISFHVSAEASRQALLEAVRQARSSFYVETFIWHDDAAGRELAETIGARKREIEAQGGSFDVKIIVDAIGLRMGGSNDAALVKRLRELGCEVKLFSPYLFSEGRVAPITHHKLYIADGSRVLTGGRNIGDEYLRETYTGGKGNTLLGWHDLLFTIFGDETGRIREEFLKNWERAGGARPTRLAPVVPDAVGAVAIETVTTDPQARTYGIREAHDRLIANAEREIFAIYPYFSDDRLIRSMIAAKRKNPSVSLKILLPGIRQQDQKGFLFELLNEESALQLLAAGAEVRMYSGAPGTEQFSHFKGLSIDTEVLSLGSANADARTFKSNHELNTLIQDVATAQDFRKQVLEKDWAASRTVTQAELQRSKFTRRVARKVLEFIDFLL